MLEHGTRGEVDLAHQIGEAGAGTQADMALDQLQPRTGTQPHDDARVAHEGRGLADGQKDQLQRVLGIGPVVQLDPGTGTGERAVECREGAVVLERGQHLGHPLLVGLQRARQAHDPHAARQALHMAELGHHVAVDEDQPARLVAAEQVGCDRVQADLGTWGHHQRHVRRLDDVGVLPVLGPTGGDALLDEAGIGTAPPVAQRRARQLVLGVGEGGAIGRQRLHGSTAERHGVRLPPAARRTRRRARRHSRRPRAPAPAPWSRSAGSRHRPGHGRGRGRCSRAGAGSG